MSFVRSIAHRASTVARSARCVRAAELQPWQRALQHRTYASAHGHGQTKKSDLPWIVSSVAGTSVALYLVLNQDLSHGSHGDVNHDEEPEKLATQPEEAQEEKSEDDKPDLEPKKDNSKAGGAKVEKDKPQEKDAPSDASEEDLDKTDISARKSDIQEGIAKQKGEPSPHEPAEDSSSPAPDESDKPNSRKPAGDPTSTSGKQQGISNDDTKHTSAIHNDPEKSKKGEGVAESAKLKGTVSTDRPGAESSQRGQAKQDKDE
ncbi:hypothetical protein BU23DRAFT_582661 [Bimuria novae-zelandiae CBS 107.79]|uniref:Cylicin I n=1 Tax=Bimuria novae-zelandiae CBS 107.79 TaxID=1447943 RepID=A0A6A5V808_9PLEO|nr:hypothetical protein BU23DRAFT_582661 [Bimuria novae-zelandiae CBS 107.79]